MTPDEQWTPEGHAAMAQELLEEGVEREGDPAAAVLLRGILHAVLSLRQPAPADLTPDERNQLIDHIAALETERDWLRLRAERADSQREVIAAMRAERDTAQRDAAALAEALTLRTHGFDPATGDPRVCLLCGRVEEYPAHQTPGAVRARMADGGASCDA